MSTFPAYVEAVRQSMPDLSDEKIIDLWEKDRGERMQARQLACLEKWTEDMKSASAEQAAILQDCVNFVTLCKSSSSLRESAYPNVSILLVGAHRVPLLKRDRWDAVVELEVSNGTDSMKCECVVDTGFNGTLALPPDCTVLLPAGASLHDIVLNSPNAASRVRKCDKGFFIRARDTSGNVAKEVTSKLWFHPGTPHAKKREQDNHTFFTPVKIGDARYKDMNVVPKVGLLLIKELNMRFIDLENRAVLVGHKLAPATIPSDAIDAPAAAAAACSAALPAGSTSDVLGDEVEKKLVFDQEEK